MNGSAMPHALLNHWGQSQEEIEIKETQTLACCPESFPVGWADHPQCFFPLSVCIPKNLLSDSECIPPYQNFPPAKTTARDGFTYPMGSGESRKNIRQPQTEPEFLI
ncbi:hypothetical protein AVEN_47605-1 [Araneus ventricosus]|uniref:Uncharacterized protein n=1 Tax=Araneus ventricosus TaxID=182803 RepID=A0A4Y2DN23_ARAVE|nr:hypothetical protein AVEN_47605-1 [Araneus ventricosus]